MPKGVEEGIVQGMYRLRRSKHKGPRVQLLGSGMILPEVVAAAECLEADYGVAADVWSVTSYTELRREGLAVARRAWLAPTVEPEVCYVTRCLGEQPQAPVVAASDYMRMVPDQIRNFIPQDYTVLGTDGFGRSDTRETLRRYFEVDSQAVAYTAVVALYRSGQLDAETVTRAQRQFGIQPDKVDPVANKGGSA